MMAKRTDRARSGPAGVINMMTRHCGTIPVVEGDARLNGMVVLRDVFLPLSRARGMRFLGSTTHAWGYDDENKFLSPLNSGLGPDGRLSACRATRFHRDSSDERFDDDQWPEDRISQNR